MVAKILVVDDLEANRDMLSRRLQHLGHLVACAESGKEALQLLQDAPFDLVMLDLMMPEMDGYQVLQAIKAQPRFMHLPVIMVSANDEMENVVKCIEIDAEDYLPKPFNPVLMRARVEASLQKKKMHDLEAGYQRELEARVREQVREISSAQLAAIFAMSKLAESRDNETGAHLERMREYCKVLAIRMAQLEKYQRVIDEDFIEAIYAASPLHDIGKVGIPDHILLKAGKLDLAEWEIMKTHAVIGGSTLRAVDEEHPGNILIRMGIDIAEAHHEKWDGSGYPHGLRTESIPLAARILALGDVYDALTSKRCYKKAFSHEDARHIIVQGGGRHFDPEVVDAFHNIEPEFIRIRQYLKDPEESPLLVVNTPPRAVA
ncbi:MAG: response regulator [Hydrogenophilales bacterium]|nr:response regulator [Hydrogenophilales bacterium]